MKNDNIFNRPEQKSLRQALRGNMPVPEQILWAKIRNHQLGVKFRRQHGIGPYIVDFYCPEAMLVIELDGHSHYIDGTPENDRIRGEFLQTLGLRVIRYLNSDVMQNLDGVLEHIMHTIKIQQD